MFGVEGWAVGFTRHLPIFSPKATPQPFYIQNRLPGHFKVAQILICLNQESFIAFYIF
jgi:hypothetical protein